jgi:23S rRNA (guanosine2251-2'-O)-methyltransferase
MIVYGINPVLEALRAGQVRRLLIVAGGGARGEKGNPGNRINEAIAAARERRLPVDRVDAQALDRLTRGGVHQGIAGELQTPRDHSLEELVAAAAPGPPLLVVLDGVEDPHNVGAILRTADGAGCHGVVRQARHAASLDGAAAKASAGAVAHVRLATVVNIARALEELEGLGVWTVGLEGTAPASYDEADFTLPTALVVGAEGSGLRRLVRERCDRLVSIPMLGSVASLNVSVATGIALFEAVRQRRRASRAGSGPNG